MTRPVRTCLPRMGFLQRREGWYFSHSCSCLLSFRDPWGERGKLGYPQRLHPSISAAQREAGWAIRVPSCSPHWKGAEQAWSSRAPF